MHKKKLFSMLPVKHYNVQGRSMQFFFSLECLYKFLLILGPLLQWKLDTAHLPAFWRNDKLQQPKQLHDLSNGKSQFHPKGSDSDVSNSYRKLCRFAILIKLINANTNTSPSMTPNTSLHSNGMLNIANTAFRSQRSRETVTQSYQPPRLAQPCRRSLAR